LYAIDFHKHERNCKDQFHSKINGTDEINK
jgi:hypothetical protein